MVIEGDKKRWIRKATCFAVCLNVRGFSLEIETSDDGASYCLRNDDGSFTIALQKGLSRYWETRHIAHEMVHLKQYKHDQLQSTAETNTWLGKTTLVDEFMSDGYFLSPWEMEARAMEDWLVHRWRKWKNELH